MIGLTVAFSFFLLLLLLLLIYSRIGWYWKAGLIVLSICGVLLFKQGLHEQLGWPMDVPPTNTVEVIKVHIIEPVGAFKGAIYYWYLEPNSRAAHTPPRAVVMPYTKEAHRKGAEMEEAIDKEETVMMRQGVDAPGFIDFDIPTFSGPIKQK